MKTRKEAHLSSYAIEWSIVGLLGACFVFSSFYLLCHEKTERIFLSAMNDLREAKRLHPPEKRTSDKVFEYPETEKRLDLSVRPKTYPENPTDRNHIDWMRLKPDRAFDPEAKRNLIKNPKADIELPPDPLKTFHRSTVRGQDTKMP